MAVRCSPLEDFGCYGDCGVDRVGDDGHPGLRAVLGHCRTQVSHYACGMQRPYVSAAQQRLCAVMQMALSPSLSRTIWILYGHSAVFSHSERAMLRCR